MNGPHTASASARFSSVIAGLGRLETNNHRGDSGVDPSAAGSVVHRTHLLVDADARRLPLGGLHAQWLRAPPPRLRLGRRRHQNRSPTLDKPSAVP
ncbi:hypothetical protein [Rhodococcus marinonascens]|uniref:hypothetical protein n=1 Tax=Rhodococcus marinonascens TaxID=38311 RepID=UPI0011146EB6|nr:hypothetical protein [Rhodococcus marinonascens]